MWNTQHFYLSIIIITQLLVIITHLVGIISILKLKKSKWKNQHLILLSTSISCNLFTVPKSIVAVKVYIQPRFKASALFSCDLDVLCISLLINVSGNYIYFLMLTILTVDRLFSAMRPLHYRLQFSKKRCGWLILLIWLVCVLSGTVLYSFREHDLSALHVIVIVLYVLLLVT